MLTVEVENLDLAKEKLPTVDSKKLVNSYLKGESLSTSDLPAEIVDGKSHSFLQAMYYCYSDHRPFVLTPESIWLLILQAFSVHINSDAKSITKKYPDFKKKRELSVRRDEINWENTKECKGVVDEFCKKLDQEIGDGFVDHLSGQFSTTTEDERMVFKISTMNTVKSFFEFVVVTVICGIPKIQITGIKEDWLEIIERLEYLRGFEFDWFVNKVIDPLRRITREFEENIDDDFWINMFKLHSTEDYGKPEMVDGWITNFFPYKKTGERTDEDYFKCTDFTQVVMDLNPQIVVLDFKHNYQNYQGKVITEIPMCMIAGFIGIEQDENTFCLTPKLGWAISRNTEEISDLKERNKYGSLVYHHLDSFPSELLTIKVLHELCLNFDVEISVPQEISRLNIGLLRINGEIARKEKKKIRKIFKNQKTLVLINGEDVNTTLFDKVKWGIMKISPFHHKHIDY